MRWSGIDILMCNIIIIIPIILIILFYNRGIILCTGSTFTREYNYTFALIQNDAHSFLS